MLKKRVESIQAQTFELHVQYWWEDNKSSIGGKAAHVLPTGVCKNHPKAICLQLENFDIRQVRKIREPELELEVQMEQSSHVAFMSPSGRVCCARCRNNFSTSTHTVVKEWLSSTCSAIGSDKDRTIPHFDTRHIGNACVHSSHKVHTFRGLIFCAKCGSLSCGEILAKLAKPCMPPTSYGKRNLICIYDNKLPPSLREWPIL